MQFIEIFLFTNVRLVSLNLIALSSVKLTHENMTQRKISKQLGYIHL